jgi:hypothetical protein
MSSVVSDNYVVMPREASRAMTMAACDYLPSCEHVFGNAGEMLRNAYLKMVEVGSIGPAPTPLAAADNAALIAAIPQMVDAINDCQSLLAMIYHIGSDSEFCTSKGFSKLLEDQLASNRAVLASIGRTL